MKEVKGLGDTIEQITKATGIKAIVDKVSEVTGTDCGCDNRKEKLNKLVPYKSSTKVNVTKRSINPYSWMEK
jgi:hypothetical protein|tara:strand:- start:8286 stop:8501 length:216 start_codon:yes stop_codon:yes gene_type:complete